MQDYKQSNALLGLLLALGLIISTFIISSTISGIKSGDNIITVKGYAEKDIESDFAIWSCNITVTSPDMVDAYKKLESDFEKVKSYLLNNGFSEKQLSVGAVHTTKNYEWVDYRRTDIITGYTLQRDISIESSDIAKIDLISSKSSELIKEGIEFFSNMPNYFYTKLDDLKIEMLAAATRDATERAQTLAENSGSSVGALRSASQGVFQITSRNSSDVSDYGIFNTSSMEKTIKSVVTMQFTIK